METKNLFFLTVNFDSSDLIARLIASLGVQTRTDYQVVIINNSPGDRQISRLESSKVTILESAANLGFGRGCNLGLNWIYQQNSQAVVWLINPDVYFASAVNLGLNSKPDFGGSNPNLSPKSQTIESQIVKRAEVNSIVSQAIAFFQQQPQISLLGTSVYSSGGELTAAGGTFTPGSAALTVVDTLPPLAQESCQDYWKTDWVSGCSLLINLPNFSQCPQFDPRYFLYYEDLDFCLRYSQQGHQIAMTNLLQVTHDTSSISDRNLRQKYRHITQSYLTHIEKHGNLTTFVITNLRMLVNTVRLLIFKPQQGWGKLQGLAEYWHKRLFD